LIKEDEKLFCEPSNTIAPPLLTVTLPSTCNVTFGGITRVALLVKVTFGTITRPLRTKPVQLQVKSNRHRKGWKVVAYVTLGGKDQAPPIHTAPSTGGDPLHPGVTGGATGGLTGGGTGGLTGGGEIGGLASGETGGMTGGGAASGGPTVPLVVSKMKGC